MKKIYLFAPIFLAAVIAFSAFSPVISMSENISDKVFRLHILANSDSAADQSLKLKVRDKILDYSKTLYSGCQSVDEAIAVTKESLGEIKEIAQKTVAFNGYEYGVSAFTARDYFSVREYDSFTLPAGNYSCLKIIIGQGKGKNWWCVMFPAVCLSGCTEDFDKSLTEEEKAMLEDRRYIVKFKIAEIYEYIKNKGGK